jgi:hypothetical protein
LWEQQHFHFGAKKFARLLTFTIYSKHQPKYNFTVREFPRIVLALWMWDDLTFIPKRYRVQITFIIHAYCWIGARIKYCFHRWSPGQVTIPDQPVVGSPEQGPIDNGYGEKETIVIIERLRVLLCRHPEAVTSPAV